MALPKLNTQKFELEIPSTEEKIKFRPFLVKEEKILLQAQEGGDNEMIDALKDIISNCTFIDNDAGRRGGSAYGGTSYTSCSFSGGAATEGGGLALATCTVSDCSFSDNMATDFGGSIFIYSSLVDIQNSTFCNSSPNHIEDDYTNSGGNTFFDDCGIGACCTHNQLTCVEAPEIQCLQFGLEFLGEGTTCENASCVTSCPGDVNGDGNVDVNDLMILIAYWGACSP